MSENETKQLDMYDPNEREIHLRKHIYRDFTYMRDLRNKRYKYFNDRTLKEFVDDSELRLTSYVPTREEQGKEDWQANFFHPVTRNKMKATLAAVALDVPDIRIVAQNEKSMKDTRRADFVKNLVKYSYNLGNKEEDIYFEGWECAGKGTVHVYDGYLKTKAKRRIIKSFDPITGAIEHDEEEVEVDNKCINFIIPIENIYIWDFYIPDIQNQPKIMWVERMDRSRVEQEFGNYPNFKYVKTQKELIGKDADSRYFNEGWAARTKDGAPYEVVRYYCKYKDEHIILINGVVMLDAPLLLGKKKKWYPIAKTVYEIFAADFYYGNSLPNTMMGEQDVTNALHNMAVDKTYKSMIPTLLIGNTNKDDFDLEDPNITLDTKIYVQDINQVKEMPSSGITNADVKMIDIIGRGLDLTTVDANQQGVAGRGVTAREIVIANENAKKIKGVFYMFLTSLWIQKVKLRIMNILTFYTDLKVKSVLKDGADSGEKIEEYRKFIVDNATLSDGSKGTLGMTIVPKNSQLPTEDQLTANEKEYSDNNGGERYEEVAFTADYLDDWEYDVKVISESIYQQDSSFSRANMEDKIKVMATAFPEIFQLNKEKVFKQTMVAYDDDPDEYETTPPPPSPEE